jgi:hypothetical protein
MSLDVPSLSERNVKKKMSSIGEILWADMCDLPDFAKEVDRDIRTIERWAAEPDGLPVIQQGNLKKIHLPTARQWLIERRMRRSSPRRKHREMS